MAPGASTGEHGRDFRPVWVEGKNPPDKWAYFSSLMSVHHALRFDSYRVRLGACWNCILTQSVNFTVVLITTPRHNILSSSILFCPIIIPCCSRLPVIPSKFSSDSASASPSGSDAIYYWNSRLIKHQVIKSIKPAKCVARCVRDGSKCSIVAWSSGTIKAVTVTQ
jgi:hypothetical protein